MRDALIALSRGEVETLEALPARLFTAAVPWPDERDSDCQRRWTQMLPSALARLDAAARARALAALDRLWRAQVDGVEDAELRAQLAVHFLPAPAASAELRRAGNRAFDHGRFQRFLAIDRLLVRGGLAVNDHGRRGYALARGGRAVVVDADLALLPPGLPVAETAGVPSDPVGDDPGDDGLTVSWAVVPGWLTARDPWGAVLWQRSLGPRTLVHAGAGAALLRDGAGGRLIDEDGAVTALPPMPEAARVAAIAGGAVWFTVVAEVHRLGLADGRLRSWRLPGVPLGPPVVRGGDSLWLCANALATIDAQGGLTELRHGLPARAGWRLLAAGAWLGVVGDGARCYRLETFAGQLAHAGTLPRAALLRAVGRDRDALAVLEGDALAAATEAGAGMLIRLLVSGSAPGDPGAVLARANAAAITPAQRALVGWWAHHAGPVLASAARGAALAALRAACTAEPGLELARDPRRLADDAASWEHVISGAAILAALDLRSPQPDARHPLHDQPVQPTLPWDDGARTAQGLLYRGRLLVLSDDGPDRVLRCTTGDGRRLWWRRWQPPPSTAAPGTSLDGRDDHLLVGEGTRVQVIGLALGDLLLAQGGGSLALSGARIAGGRLMALTAFGADRDLVLTGGDGVEHHALPASARWLAPCGDGVVVALLDGRCLRYPGGTPVELPAAVTAGDAPAATAEGLISGGKLWRWRER